TKISHNLGLASEDRLKAVDQKVRDSISIIEFLRQTSVSPEDINPILVSRETEPLKQKQKLAALLQRPQISLEDLTRLPVVSKKLAELDPHIRKEVTTEVEIQIKYESYFSK